MLASQQQNLGGVPQNEIDSLVAEFVKWRTSDEEALFTKAKVYRKCGKFADEKVTLQNAIKEHIVAPKSALRLSDIYFEQGEYNKAIPLLNRAISNAAQPQPPINISYCYLLRALCKIAPLLNEDEKSMNNISADRMGIEKITEEIFEDAHTASQMGGLNDTLLLNLRQMIRLMEFRFGVKNPYWDE